MLYTTWGPTRGGCGEAHRTLAAAARCLKRDRSGCRRQGGYSDRSIREITDSEKLWGWWVADHGPGPAISAELEEEVQQRWDRAEWV